MKKLIALICIVLVTASANATDDKIVKSTISKVTVFSQGAQVYRSANYNVSQGVTQIIIEGVSPKIDANSLQVNASGNVIILDSKYSLFYPEPAKVELSGLPLKIRKSIGYLEDSIQKMDYEILTYQDEIDVLVATKNILANNGAIRGQGKVNDSIQLLQQAIDYYTFKMMEINNKLQVLNLKKYKGVTKRSGMKTRLLDLRNYQNNADLANKPKGPSHRITITLKSDETVNGKIDVSYLVSNAGWTPLYDLRSDMNTGKVNLNYKAQVFQNTGIDWSDIRLTISTNNPYQNKMKPELHPWYVDFRSYSNYSEADRDEENKGKDINRLQKKAEAYGYSQPTSSPGATEVEDAETKAIFSNQFTEVIDHVISAEFRIDLPYSIESNGQKHMVLVKNEDLNAEFKYYTVPKYDQSVYLVAQLSKLDELQLVPAKANIFFDGSYIGETYLDPTTMDDTLSLSMGKDPNIIVKRTLLKHDSKDKVVGTKMEKTYAYAIEVKNLKSSNIELIVQDQIPVTQNADIEIEALELSKGILDKRTGIIEWSFNLKAKGKKDLEMKYEVKFDKDQNVVL
jgi:uncharacterized protein (TIGR02231 family)